MLLYLRYESRVRRALALHAAGPVTLGLGVLPVFHGGAAGAPLQPVFHFTNERTKKKKESREIKAKTDKNSQACALVSR